MPRLISVEVKPLGELFASDRRFRLPWFQRAYSWQTPQVARLIGDLLEAMAAPEGEDYLLGTLMLADVEGGDGLAIVDGHQRIVTLTIVAAVLRDLEPAGPVRSLLEGIVAGDGQPPWRPRLVPQANVAEFLEAYVQRDGGTMLDVDESEIAFSEGERRIVEVREYLKSRFSMARDSAAVRARLPRFLFDRCRVVVHLYDCEDYAWRALNVEEDTRVAFALGAQAKATILGVVPHADREIAVEAWERCEDRLGTTAIGELLSYIRTLKSRRRSNKPIEHEICRLFDIGRNPREFVDGWLVPHSRSLEALRLAAHGGGALRPEIEACVARLYWIEQELWLPAALRWLEVQGAEHEHSPEFFRLLDRLIWILRLSSVDPSGQMRTIIEVLGEIDRGLPPAEMVSLSISWQLTSDAVSNLRSRNFCLKSYAAMVLRRLSLLHGRDSGPVDKKNVTIEHVLPRNPDKNQDWRAKFSSAAEVRAYVNRLGNLTFLSQADNQLASTKRWPLKREILARSGFVLSEQAALIDEWDQAAITARTEELVALLLSDWQLTE